ncbi:uncharacterized protein LOC132797357 [Drosophila nasuta]|uniref:uncharacterized protein LOC132797357 n=1 Tax=Drosophila nasuta TaxID=42062 RepID=UPI00295F17B8|nr:uncharacterized protein LOC132797357 [Drosophila nasuta]
MDVDLSLDEIIERKRTNNPPHRANEKKLNAIHMKPRKPLNKAAGGHQRNTFDARNKIIQKTRAKIIDARDILNQNIRDSGIDARSMLIERKKERMPLPMPPMPMPPPQSSRIHARVGGNPGIRGHGRDRVRDLDHLQHDDDDDDDDAAAVHKGRFGQRIITMSNRPGGLVQTLWNPKDDLGGYKTSRLNAAAKPFVPRGYVDYDNMQQLEDEEIARTLHMGSYNSGGSQKPGSGSRPRMATHGGYDGYGLEMDGVEITSPGINDDPFAIYESSRNRLERPALPPLPPPPNVVGHVGKSGDTRQRSLVATSNLPDSLRARLFGSEPDPRVSHGIYANENGSGQSKSHGGIVAPGLGSLHSQRRSPPSISMPLPLSVVNNKPGYRLLVSNLHANVTTADIRELFNDIGPMYDARVVRPGTAEVIYKSLEHAEMAVDAYHQREFDGQPMHCVLVNPHSSNRSNHSVNSRTVTTNSSGVEVDIDALHSVLFRDR